MTTADYVVPDWIAETSTDLGVGLAEVVSIMAEPEHRAAVAALAAEGVDPTPPALSVLDAIRAAALAWTWTLDDVLAIGDTIDGHGCVTVVLRRGSRVQHVPVRLVSTPQQIAAQAVTQANGLRS
jgi:hypothetical protein